MDKLSVKDLYGQDLNATSIDLEIWAVSSEEKTIVTQLDRSEGRDR